MTALDIQAMDVIGWNLASTSATAVPEPASAAVLTVSGIQSPGGTTATLATFAIVPCWRSFSHKTGLSAGIPDE